MANVSRDALAADRVGDRIDAAPASPGSDHRSSRASRLTAAARLPPALSPATAIRLGSTPSRELSCRRPAVGGDGVFDRGRKGVLGSEPVIDREHRGGDVGGEEAADAVAGVEVADCPAAAVEVDDQRPVLDPGSRRFVEPRRDRPRRSRDRQVVTRWAAARFGPAAAAAPARILARRLLRRELAVGRCRLVPDQARQPQQRLHLRRQHLSVDLRRRPEERPAASRAAARRRSAGSGARCAAAAGEVPRRGGRLCDSSATRSMSSFG